MHPTDIAIEETNRPQVTRQPARPNPAEDLLLFLNQETPTVSPYAGTGICRDDCIQTPEYRNIRLFLSLYLLPQHSYFCINQACARNA